MKKIFIIFTILSLLPMISINLLFESSISVSAIGINTKCKTNSAIWNDSFSSGWEDRFKIYNSYDEQNREIINDLEKDSVLRVHYPSGSRNPGSDNPGGTGFRSSEFVSSDELCLSYDLKFKDGFDFVRGGKLPGLAGGDGNTGGSIPNGSDGFSARYMWRSNGAGEVYAYLPTSTSYGTSLGAGNWIFNPNQWHNLTQHIKLNSPGQNNGEINVFLDGNKVYSIDNLNFRSAQNLKIDQLLFSTFFGGNDDSWSTTKDEYIDFANIAIYEPINITNPKINIKILLEGALINENNEYDNQMRNFVSQNNNSIPDNYIDIVEVELKDENNSSIETKLFYIDWDGYLINTDNLSRDLIFSNSSDNEYYINVTHRNHIGIGSQQTIDFGNDQLIDFSTNNNTINENQKNLPDGRYALHFGNTDDNKKVRNSGDRNIVLNESTTINSYSNIDINMDGKINSTDRNLTINNSSSLIEYLN